MSAPAPTLAPAVASGPAPAVAPAPDAAQPSPNIILAPKPNQWDRRRADVRAKIRHYQTNLENVKRGEKGLLKETIVLLQEELGDITKQQRQAMRAAAEAARRPPEPPLPPKPAKKKVTKRKAAPKAAPKAKAPVISTSRRVKEVRPSNKKLLDSTFVQRMSASR
ncbi:hypothetical protein V8F06_004190 [Rhypophila decipiens]